MSHNFISASVLLLKIKPYERSAIPIIDFLYSFATIGFTFTPITISQNGRIGVTGKFLNTPPST